MEAYGERTFRGERALAGVRAGRFRTPFGISGGSDHGYGGFLRAPLIRYAGYWALANTFLEHGVNVMAGVPALQMEYTIGTPSDVGDGGREAARRRRPGDPRPGLSRRRHRRRDPHPHAALSARSATRGAAPCSRAWTRAGCATASSFAANGSTVSPSTACTRAAATSMRSCTGARWARSPPLHVPRCSTTTPEPAPCSRAAPRSARA